MFEEIKLTVLLKIIDFTGGDLKTWTTDMKKEIRKDNSAGSTHTDSYTVETALRMDKT